MTPATATWPALGTTALVATVDPDRLAAARAAVETEVAAIDRACSRFRPDAELVALNARAGRETVVSPLLAAALAVALRAARISDGAVDPTLGADLVRAGYDRDFAEVVASPDGPAREGAAARVAGGEHAGGETGGGVAGRLLHFPGPRASWRAIELDRARRTVRVPAGVVLDLGATAKALAADRAAAAAHVAAGCGVLVSLGGDVALAGPPPPGGWPIRVADDHAAPVDGPGQTVSLSSGGLATSGTTVRRWRRDGREHHHIIDPVTRRPAAVVWRTASVAAATCVDANIASTAAIVRGLAAPAWLARAGLPARLTSPDGTVVRTCGWPSKRERARAA